MASTAPQQSPGTEGPRSRKGARSRTRLLEAAKLVFEDDGFLEARISDIAERAGLSHGSFYYYFDSKEQIFREVAAAMDAELAAPIADVILPRSSVTPRERLRESLRRHFESYRAEARIMGVIEQVSRYDEEVREVRGRKHRRYAEQVAASIRQLQEHGLADPELDPELVADSMRATTERFAEMWFVQGVIDCSFDEGVDHVARLFANALRLPE